MTKDLYKEYVYNVSKEERIAQRKLMVELVKTKEYSSWLSSAFKGQRRRCFYCDEKISKQDRKTYHLEHRVPIYRGGQSVLSNLVLACPSCNLTKGTDQLIRNKKWLNKINQRRVQAGFKPKLYT